MTDIYGVSCHFRSIKVGQGHIPLQTPQVSVS